MSTTKNELKEIQAEVDRFQARLTAAKQRLEKEEMAKYGCLELGALKRSALDLKQLLTKKLSPARRSY